MWVGDVLNICPSGSPPPPPPPPPPGGIGAIMSQTMYNSQFPNRNARYTYQNLISAGSRFPGFCGGSDATANKRELAMFLANSAHETSDYYYVCEACNTNNCAACSSTYNYGGDSTHQFYGRGALQLSWNYNYQSAGNALGVNFMNDPTIVATTSDYVFSTALWFWMSASNGGCHNAAQQNLGFAETIKIINGGIECGKASGTVGNNEMNDRVSRYLHFCSVFGISSGSSNLYC